MKDALLAPIAIPIGIVIYVISFVLSLLFLNWFFDRPQDWSYVIPITTSLIALGAVHGVIEEYFGKISARVTLIIIAGFWIFMVGVDIFGFMSDIVAVFQGNYVESDPGVIDIINAVLSTKIYAITSACLAFGD